MKTAAVGAAGALAGVEASAPAVGQDAPAEASRIPTATLGKTGRKVSILGMGTSWKLSPSFVQAALFSGVRYIDTSETYENTRCESVLGEVLERTKMRKDVYLVTKNSVYRKGMGSNALKTLESRLDASLQRLKTDYIDSYYLHGVEGSQIELLRDPEVKAAFEELKRKGKILFCGFSCHDGRLPEILTAAAEAGWMDQVMFKYNFRDVGGKDRHDELQRAIDKAAKANLGLVAMKTQGGAVNFPDKMAMLKEKGFKKEVAAVKTVWMDGRIQVAVSEMTNRSDLRENIAATRDQKLSARDARLLEEYRRTTAHLYCHGCGHLCETAARGVPVATVLRYLRYYEVYGKRQEARALYQALPPAARDLAAADLTAAALACPHGLPVAELVRRADDRLRA